MGKKDGLQSHLQKRCKHWQKLLRLQDWEIDVQVVRYSHYNEARVPLGTCQDDQVKRFAQITILDPTDILVVHPCTNADPELTLVHELMHLYFNSDLVVGKEPKQVDNVIETGVEALSEALWKLSRGEG